MLNLADQTCDTQFDIRVVGGWNGESKPIDFLKETPVPLRVYGNWQQLNYSLQVDQLLRKHLQDEAKRRLNDWAERNKDSRNGKDVKKLLEDVGYGDQSCRPDKTRKASHQAFVAASLYSEYVRSKAVPFT